VLSKHPRPYYLAKQDTHTHFGFQVVFDMSCNTLNPQTSQDATKLRKDAQTCQIKILATSPLYL
jgi:hypothetical protein